MIVSRMELRPKLSPFGFLTAESVTSGAPRARRGAAEGRSGCLLCVTAQKMKDGWPFGVALWGERQIALKVH